MVSGSTAVVRLKALILQHLFGLEIIGQLFRLKYNNPYDLYIDKVTGIYRPTTL